MKRTRRTTDMVNGPLIPQIIRFALPLMATGILQQLYNSADMIVVGRFVSGEALAAVGATSTLCALLRTAVTGLSLGASVLVANACGSGDKQNVERVVHSSLALALVVGVASGALGYLLCDQMLIWTGAPQNVFDQAALYMRIFFLGMPLTSLYNFAAAPIRAMGDSRTPMLILVLSGLVNVLLNLYMVAVLHMGVAGVAWATFISQALSVVLAMGYLMRSREIIHVSLRKIRFYGQPLLGMLRVGVPSAVQNSLFTLSNILIQAGVNSFGSDAIAGNSAGHNIEVLVFFVLDAFTQAATIFAGQNMGAKNYRRLPQVLWSCLLVSGLVVTLVDVLVCVFRYELVGLFSTEAAIIEYGAQKVLIMMSSYTLVCLMYIPAGFMRGCGYSILPTVISLIGNCGLRPLWLFTVFAWYPSFEVLMWCYPFTWVMTGAVNLICYFAICRKKLLKLRKSEV